MEYYWLSVILLIIFVSRFIASLIIANLYVNINIKSMNLKDKSLYLIVFIFLPEILVGTTIKSLLYQSKIRIMKQRIRYKSINNKYRYKYK